MLQLSAITTPPRTKLQLFTPCPILAPFPAARVMLSCYISWHSRFLQKQAFSSLTSIRSAIAESPGSRCSTRKYPNRARILLHLTAPKLRALWLWTQLALCCTRRHLSFRIRTRKHQFLHSIMYKMVSFILFGSLYCTVLSLTAVLYELWAQKPFL